MADQTLYAKFATPDVSYTFEIEISKVKHTIGKDYVSVGSIHGTVVAAIRVHETDPPQYECNGSVDFKWDGKKIGLENFNPGCTEGALEFHEDSVNHFTFTYTPAG